MKAFSNQISPDTLLSKAQLDRFKESLIALEEASSLVLNNSENKHYLGMIAFDMLMMSGTITAAWQMLKSLEKAKAAFENKKISSDFFESKTKSIGHFIDSILPRYLAHFTTISATSC